MKFCMAFALTLLMAMTTIARADNEPTAAGFWEVRDSDGNPTGWFLFTQKNEVYSGRLVKGFKPPGDDKPPQLLCTECPGKKKGARIMGMTLFWGMKRDGLHYTDGSVLDPRDGTVYHALMNLSEDGKELEVRGYLGIPMLGKSQTWYRLPDDAMAKEDIPKELLANGDEVAGDKTDKPKVHGDKAKGHKLKAKLDKPPESTDTPTADPTKDAN